MIRGGSDLQEELLAHVTGNDTDYLFSIHFPAVLPSAVFPYLGVGAVNLHPSLLPYNRGWHTPSWSILEGTPAGATLHFMTERLDEGEIIAQREVEVRLDDTANSLYQRVLQTEFELFRDAFDQLLSLNPNRTPQDDRLATFHKRADLFEPHVNILDSATVTQVREVWDRMRALTTSQADEALRIRINGKMYRIRIEIQEDM